MADNELNVQVSDDGYESSLREAIKLNKELEAQLFKTANILKSNNTEYRNAYAQLAKYVNALNNLNVKINQTGGYSKAKNSGNNKQTDYNKGLTASIKLNKQLENQLNRTASAMRSATDGYGKAANKLKDLNSELKSLHDNLGGKSNLSVNVNRVAGDNSGGVTPNINPQDNNTPVDNTNNAGGTKKGILGKISSFGGKAFNFVSNKLSGSLGNMIGSTRLGSALNVTQFSKLTKMIGPIGGLIAMLIAVVKLGLAGLKDRVANIQGKLAMGESNAFTESTINSMNSLNSISSKVKQTFEGLRSTAANLITAFTSLIDSASKSVEGLDEWLGKQIYKLGNNGSDAGYQSYYESDRGKYNISTNELSEVENLIGTEGRKLGFDNASIKEMQDTIVERSADLAKQFGATTYDMAKTVINDIFSGNQDLAQYGIVVDDDVLAGWAALKKGIDIVNVSYSDAALAGLRYELVLEQMSKAGTKGLQDNIKMLKEQGALMQKNKNNVSEFEEVLKISGYDENIPDIFEEYVVGIKNTSADLDTLKAKLNGLDDQHLSWFIDVFGGEVPEDILAQISKLDGKTLSVMIDTGVLETKEDVNKLAKLLETNEPAVITALMKFGGIENMDELERAVNSLSDEQIDILVQLAGVESVEDLKELVDSLTWEQLKALEGVLPDEVIDRFKKLKKELDLINQSSDTASDKLGSVFGMINKAIEEGTLKMDHTTGALEVNIGDKWLSSTGASTFIGATIQPSSSGSIRNANSIANSIIGNMYSTSWENTSSSDLDTPSVLNMSPGYYTSESYLPRLKHANGGISTSHHIAEISEGNKPEAIIPLSSSAANPAYEQIGRAVAMAMGGMNDGLSGGQTIINVAPNSTVIGDQAGLRKLAALMESNIALLKRDRGELDYGINK